MKEKAKAIALLVGRKVGIFNLWGKAKARALLFGPKVAIFKLGQFMGESKGYSLAF